MGSLLHRRVRTHVLQGHSVQNTSLENSLCIVKQLCSFSVGKAEWAQCCGHGWPCRSQGICLAVTCRNPMHTHCPHVHTHRHMLWLLLCMLPTLSPWFCLDLIKRLSLSSHLTCLNSCLGFSPLGMALPQGAPLPSLSQFLPSQKWTCSGSAVSLCWVHLSSIQSAKFNDLIPPTPLAAKWLSFPMDISLQKMLVEELTNPVVPNGHISLKHMGSFFSPTTAPNRISGGDYHCLIAFSTTNVHPLPYFLPWRPL